jgi:hypothetical protein
VNGVLLIIIKNFAIKIYLLKFANIYIKIYAMKKDMTLTSVKVQSELFDEFKVACVRHKFSFQKLADRCVHLYLTDEDFKRQIHNHTDLNL